MTQNTEYAVNGVKKKNKFSFGQYGTCDAHTRTSIEFPASFTGGWKTAYSMLFFQRRALVHWQEFVSDGNTGNLTLWAKLSQLKTILSKALSF